MSSAQSPDPSVHRPIPRRARIEISKRRDDFTAERAPQAVTPGAGSVLRRFVLWTRALLRFLFACLGDRLRKRHSRRRDAIHFREMLESMGGTGIKIGQQLGLRADIIPIEYCDELTALLDRVPPFPSDVAIRIVETETGRPLSDVFESFDPEVIGSGSIGCVYQAHLRDGTKVAVKVRRPGIELEMRSDLKVLELLGRTAEALSLAAPGSTRHPIREITRMLLDELDYRLEAQQTEVFGRHAAERGVVSVPPVFHELSGREVIVTGFVDGIFLHEILNAMEDEDPAGMEALAAQGYDPVEISKRLVRMMFWQMFESDIFHADPHPANIVVHPDNSITLIDFGVCGALSRRARRGLQAMYRHHKDPHEMARAIISTQQPLPYIDVDQYAQELYYIVRDQTLAMNSTSAKWYEKSSGALWAKASEIGREYKVRLNPELLRYMRTSFLGDAILVRLNPSLNMAEEFRACYDEYVKRVRNDGIESGRRNWRRIMDETLMRVRELTEVIALEIERRRQIAERPTYRYAVRVEKSAFAAAAFLKALVWTSAGLLAFAGARAASLWFSGRDAATLQDNLAAAATHPAFLVYAALALLITLRKVNGRLEEPDLAGR